MVSIIHQKAMFSASPRELFNIYLDSKKHCAAIDDKASIQPQGGQPIRGIRRDVAGANVDDRARSLYRSIVAGQ